MLTPSASWHDVSLESFLARASKLIKYKAVGKIKNSSAKDLVLDLQAVAEVTRDSERKEEWLPIVDHVLHEMVQSRLGIKVEAKTVVLPEDFKMVCHKKVRAVILPVAAKSKVKEGTTKALLSALAEPSPQPIGAGQFG